MNTNESDRELLELAAKAAGYDVAWNDGWECFQHRSPAPDQHGHMRHPWMPLADDGDALRLAVKLNMSISINHHDDMHDREFVEVEWDGPNFTNARHREEQGDPLAATRRAIVRAAAEIGKQHS